MVQEFETALWGPSGVGKSMLLGRITRDNTHKNWQVLPGNLEAKSFQSNIFDVFKGGHWPKPTHFSTRSQQEYSFSDSSTHRLFNVKIVDRAGIHNTNLAPEVIKALRAAHGLVLLFSPEDEPSHLREYLGRIAVEVQQTSFQRDKRPYAICFTKMDLYIETEEQFHRMINEPHEFVEANYKLRDHVEYIKHFCKVFRLFPVSAAGVNMISGSLRSAHFYDDHGLPRLVPDAQPINVLSPFIWLFSQVSEISKG